MPTADPPMLRLAETLAAKLCHDFAGTVGSLAGTLELMAEDPDSRDDLIPIAVEAVASLTGRLRLMRAACAGPQEALSPTDLADLCLFLSASGRVTADFSALPPVPLAPPLAQLLLCALLLGAEGLPRGGIVSVTVDGDGGLIVRLDGPRAEWPAPLLRSAADPCTLADIGPRGILAPLATLIARAQGARLRMGHGGTDPKTGPMLLVA